jgi:hypothetical protein
MLSWSIEIGTNFCSSKIEFWQERISETKRSVRLQTVKVSYKAAGG